MIEVLLKDIVANYPKENIINWEYLQLNYSNRLYYKLVDSNTSGFFFCDVEMTSCISHEEFNPESTEVEVLYEGIAYFDGIRHLYMGSEQTDNYGYVYYTHLDTHIQVLTKLKELEIKYCPSK